MKLRHCSLLVLVFAAVGRLAPTAFVTAQTLNSYDSSRVGPRSADGQSLYPSGVIDPSRSNPQQPPTNVAVPLPPQPDTPIRSVPQAYSAGTATGPYLVPSTPQYGASQYGQQQYYGPAVPSNIPQSQIYPLPTAAPPQTSLPQAAQSLPATWYTRIDYFHWNEKIGSMDFVNESGALFTVGYQRQVGIERFRGEIFGGVVDYDGYGQFGNGTLETLKSNTGYLGLRGEYELVLPAFWQGGAFLAGFGSRYWIRDLHDGTTDSGDPVWGYQENWWTFYPYLGLTTSNELSCGLELYTEMRAGATVLTYQFASIGDRPLWPTPGFTGNVELGLRGSRFYAAVRGEWMRWEDSPIVQDAYQPRSAMYTVGGRFGVMF